MKKPVPTAPTAPVAPVVAAAETAPVAPVVAAVETAPVAPVVAATETAPVAAADLPRIMDVVHKDTGRTMTVSKAYYLAHAGKLTIA